MEQMNFDLTKVYRSRKTLDTINALREMGENIAYTTKNQPYTQEIKVVTAEIKKRTGSRQAACRSKGAQPPCSCQVLPSVLDLPCPAPLYSIRWKDRSSLFFGVARLSWEGRCHQEGETSAPGGERGQSTCVGQPLTETDKEAEAQRWSSPLIQIRRPYLVFSILTRQASPEVAEGSVWYRSHFRDGTRGECPTTQWVSPRRDRARQPVLESGSLCTASVPHLQHKDGNSVASVVMESQGTSTRQVPGAHQHTLRSATMIIWG